MKTIPQAPQRKLPQSGTSPTIRLLTIGFLVTTITMASSPAWSAATNPAKVVTYPAPSGEYLVQIEGADAEHDVRDVTFENVSITGSKLTEKSEAVRMGKHTKNVRFHAESSAR
jgi:hypothetical protein